MYFAPQFEKYRGRELSILTADYDSIEVSDPPKDISHTTTMELEDIEAIVSESKLPKSLLKVADEEPVRLFTSVAKKHKLDPLEQEAEEVSKDWNTIAFYFKDKFRRRRPSEVLKEHDKEFPINTTSSSVSPSYPSGHSMMGYGLAEFYKEKYPYLSDEWDNIADVIAHSRIQLGVHFPSDNKASKSIVAQVVGQQKTASDNHVETRRKQRAKYLDPKDLKEYEARVKRTKDLPNGANYITLPHGRKAVVRTEGGKSHLATILGPAMRPPGKDVSSLVKKASYANLLSRLAPEARAAFRQWRGRGHSQQNWGADLQKWMSESGMNPQQMFRTKKDALRFKNMQSGAYQDYVNYTTRNQGTTFGQWRQRWQRSTNTPENTYGLYGRSKPTLKTPPTTTPKQTNVTNPKTTTEPLVQPTAQSPVTNPVEPPVPNAMPNQPSFGNTMKGVGNWAKENKTGLTVGTGAAGFAGYKYKTAQANDPVSIATENVKNLTNTKLQSGDPRYGKGLTRPQYKQVVDTEIARRKNQPYSQQYKGVQSDIDSFRDEVLATYDPGPNRPRGINPSGIKTYGSEKGTPRMKRPYYPGRTHDYTYGEAAAEKPYRLGKHKARLRPPGGGHYRDPYHEIGLASNKYSPSYQIPASKNKDGSVYTNPITVGHEYAHGSLGMDEVGADAFAATTDYDIRDLARMYLRPTQGLPESEIDAKLQKTYSRKSHDHEGHDPHLDPKERIELFASRFGDGGMEKTQSVNDLSVLTAVPKQNLDLIMRKGLASQKAISEDPELTKAFLDQRGVKEEDWRKELSDALKGFKPDSRLGASVFFSEPDPDKVSDPRHFINQFDTTKLRVNLGKLLKDIPETRFHGVELEPFNEEAWEADPDNYPSRRHRDLSTDEIAALIAKDPKELWKHYKDEYIGKLYAGDVPHGMVVTPSGIIPPEYLEQVEKTSEAKRLYHGSPLDLEELELRVPPHHTGKGEAGEAGVYAADNPIAAALYALARNKSKGSWGVTKDNRLVMKDYKELNPEGYVYELDSSDNTPPPEDHPALGYAVRDPNIKSKRKITAEDFAEYIDKVKTKEQFLEALENSKTAEAQPLLRHRSTLLIRDPDTNKLLAAKAPEGSKASPYYFPGGGLYDDEYDTPRNPTEEEVIEGARREALEELGIELDNPRVVGTFGQELEGWWKEKTLRNRGVPYLGGHEHYVLADKGKEDRSLYNIEGDAFEQGEYYDPKAIYKALSRVAKSKTDPFAPFNKEQARAIKEHLLNKQAALEDEFQPDLTPDALKALGVYDQVYGDAPSEASMKEWPEHWINKQDPLGWLQWYDRYSGGRRTDDDERQMKRWKSFKARHLAQYLKKPTPRRAAALRNWGFDVEKY